MIITRTATTTTMFEWFVGEVQQKRVTDSVAPVGCFHRCGWPTTANQTPGEVAYKLLNIFSCYDMIG